MSNISIKKRKSAIYKQSNIVSKKYLLLIANSMFLSKLNFHLELWEYGLKRHGNIFNHLQIEVVKMILPNEKGKTDDYSWRKLNWLNIYTRYKHVIMRFTFRLLNHEITNRHYLYYKFTKNRYVWNKSQNKIGPRPYVLKSELYKQKTYFYQIISIFNNIKT